MPLEESKARVGLRFDRGTLVVTAAGGASLEGLPFIVWDPRVRAFRAPAFRYRALARALEDGGLAVERQLRPLAPLNAEWRALELRSYQTTAVEAWEQSGRRGIVALPTGSGKTRVALAAIRRLALPTLVLVPTIALLDQWCVQLSAFTSVTIGRLGDGVRRVEAITVSTYESAYRQMSMLGDRFGLLVVDEAHHFGAGIRDEALEMSLAAARLGLTGTYPRDPVHRERLERLLGPVVYERGIAALMGEHLAPLTRNRILVELDPEERLRYALHLEAFQTFETVVRASHPDARWQDLVRIGAKSIAGRRALRSWREIRRLLAYNFEKRRRLEHILAHHRGLRTLIFCADNEAAYAIAREHLVMPITCDIGRAERRQALEQFVTGRLRGLVSARVLNEGIDLPDAEVAIVVSAAFGEREHLQRIGRVLRPKQNKEALLYELITRDTLEAGWAQRRSRGLHSRERLRVRTTRVDVGPSLFGRR